MVVGIGATVSGMGATEIGILCCFGEVGGLGP